LASDPIGLTWHDVEVGLGCNVVYLTEVANGHHSTILELDQDEISGLIRAGNVRRKREPSFQRKQASAARTTAERLKA